MEMQCSSRKDIQHFELGKPYEIRAGKGSKVSFCRLYFLRPNKKNKCVLGNGSENFRHTYIFFIFFFSGKKYNVMHFERQIAFQNA